MNDANRRPVIGIGPRHRGEQRLRVGMHRTREHRFGRAELRHAAEIHHADAGAEMLDQRKIVRHDEIGQPELVLDVCEKILWPTRP
jgi:hypothetical protein